MGCFSSAQPALLPTIMTAGIRWRTSESTSMSEKPAAPSPISRNSGDCGWTSPAASAKPGPVPRQPYGPGSSQRPGCSGSTYRPAKETKSPPSPMTTESGVSLGSSSP